MNRKKWWVGIILGGVLLCLILGTFLSRPAGNSGGSMSKSNSGSGVIGVVRVDGTLIEGGGSSGIFATTDPLRQITDNLRAAGEDPTVQAVLIRMNSPGGSVPTSQEIAREVQRIREAGKPVVVSMGDMAASGGYMVAVEADWIVANPGTMTGSIGVIWEVDNYAELFEKLGIDAEMIKSGQYKDMGSAYRSLTEEERQLIQGIVDESYQQFVEQVAQRRGDRISREQLSAIADGRVITGQQAYDLGLIDELGSFYDAVDSTAKRANLGSNPTLKEFSQSSSWSWFL